MKNTFEVINYGNSTSKFDETTNTQIQGVQQTPSTGNIKKDTKAHYDQFAHKQ